MLPSQSCTAEERKEKWVISLHRFFFLLTHAVLVLGLAFVFFLFFIATEKESGCFLAMASHRVE